MRTLLAALVLLLPAALLAQSQMEMTEQACADFQKADRELNAVYNRLQKALDAEGREKLKAAQRAWIVFRDAEAAFQADLEARGGSMEPMCDALAREKLTQARTAELQAMLDAGR